MSPSGAEYLREIKSQVEEVDPSRVSEHLGNGIVLVDVRESTEWDAGHIPGAKHVPRAYLESRIEGAVGAGRDQEIILYCASGQRSALAAHTLTDQLGYTNVKSTTGGLTMGKDRGYKVDVPKALAAEQRERYSRHLLVPEIGLEGQTKLLESKVLLLGAGGRGCPTGAHLHRPRRRRHARRRGRRRGRPLHLPAPGDPHDRRHRLAEGRLRRARDHRDQPGRQ